MNKDYFQTTTILPFPAAKITNKQISFARPDNTKAGDRPWAGLSRNILVPTLLVALNHFIFAIWENRVW
ncbi:MAG TPA: hypothetical protein VFS97_00290 [Nitrososphaeraceae archaeon]|nr:hypothetical protein [Nitrososphaeraceae archaeon]